MQQGRYPATLRHLVALSCAIGVLVVLVSSCSQVADEGSCCTPVLNKAAPTDDIPFLHFRRVGPDRMQR